MLKLARDAGASVHRDGSEAEAWLELPPDSLASHIDEMVGTQAAELNYRMKAHLHRVGTLLGLHAATPPSAPESTPGSAPPGDATQNGDG
jgi:hypothetical protein